MKKTTKPKKKTVKKQPIRVLAENSTVWQPTPQLRAMAEMLVNPDDRRPKADKAKAAGLTERTFYRWMKDERYINFINSLVDRYSNAELPNVWKALLRQCNMGNVAAIKVYIELMGIHPEFKHKIEMDKHKVEYDKELLEIRKKELELKDF